MARVPEGCRQRTAVFACLLQALTVQVLAAGVALGQAAADATPVPKSAVQVENTNAAYAPTEVDVPQANPARPTVTLPAHLPPTGYLQFEQGFQRAAGSPAGTAGQSALLQTTKIAVATRLMVQFITEPYAYSTVANADGTTTHSSDPGDLLVGAVGVIHKTVGAAPTMDVAYTGRVRTGTSANLDVGSYAQSVLVLFGGDLRGNFHYDSNLIVNEQTDGPVRRAQFAQTLAVSHPLFPRATHKNLTGTAELSHFTQPFTTGSSDGIPVLRANTLGLLFAAAYAVRPNLVVDSAFDHGLTSTSTQWAGSFGITYLLPHRLWPDRHPVPIAVGRSRF